MNEIRAAITGIGAYLPEYRLTNDEISTMVDTNDEWIMQRIGIKERRILKGEGLATSDMGTEAIKELLKKTQTRPDEIELLICATITPDTPLPAASNIICNKAGLTNAWSFDLNAACSGFIFALTTGAKFIESGQYKKVIVLGADKMSAITNYKDRATCPLFGDGAAAVLLEPTTEDLGLIDHIVNSYKSKVAVLCVRRHSKQYKMMSILYIRKVKLYLNVQFRIWLMFQLRS